MLKVNYRIAACLLCSLSMLACSDSNTAPEDREIYYYDVRGQLNAQLQELSTASAHLNKSTQVDEVVEEAKLQPDSAGWRRELDIFFQADINKPVFKNLYNDSSFHQSDTLVRVYQSKEKRETGVNYLKVYQMPEGVTAKLEAEFSEKNNMYTSERLMQLFFIPSGDSIRLSHYRISGLQKMILKDAVKYNVAGEIIWP